MTHRFAALLVGLSVVAAVAAAEAPGALAATSSYYLQLQNGSGKVLSSGANLSDADELDTNVAQACSAPDTVNFYVYGGIGAWNSAAITNNDTANLGTAAANPYYKLASGGADQWVSWPSIGTGSSGATASSYTGDGASNANASIGSTSSLINDLGAGTYTFAVACQDASSNPVSDSSSNLIAASLQVQVASGGWAVVPEPVTMDFSQLSGSNYSSDNATLSYSVPSDLSGDEIDTFAFANQAAASFATETGDPTQASWDLGAIDTAEGSTASDDPFFNFNALMNSSATSGTVAWPNISTDSDFSNYPYYLTPGFSYFTDTPSFLANYGPGTYTLGLDVINSSYQPTTDADGDPIAGWVTVHVDAGDNGWQVTGSGSSEATAPLTTDPKPTSMSAAASVGSGSGPTASLSATVSGFDTLVGSGGSVEFYELLPDNSQGGKAADPATDLKLGAGTYNASTGSWSLTTNSLTSYSDPNTQQPNTYGYGTDQFYAVFVPDSSGSYQQSDTEQAPAGVLIAAPPTVSVSPASVTTAIGDPVTLNGSATPGPGSTAITDYTWQFADPGGNSVGSDDTGTTASDTHTFTAPGTYTATLKSTEQGGQTGTATELIHVEGPAPTAAVTATPSSVAPDRSVRFDASNSTAGLDSVINEYFWNFGDGSTDNTITATDSHTYASAGIYPVTVTVEDVDGQTATATITVTVAAAVAPPPPPTARTPAPTPTTTASTTPMTPTSPPARPPFSAGARSVKTGLVTLTLRVPSAGKVKVLGTVTTTRIVKRKRRSVTTTVWATTKSEQAGSRKLTLKPSAKLATLLGKSAERVTLKVSYTRRGAKAVTKRLSVRLPRLKAPKSEKSGKTKKTGAPKKTAKRTEKL